MNNETEIETDIRNLPLPARDYLESIKDLTEFVKKSKKRDLNDSQIIMILKRRLLQIKNASNTLTMELQRDINVLIDTYSYSVSLFNQLLNIIPDKEEYEDIWLELNALQNIAIAIFASLILLASDQLRFLGQANLLSQMILGVETIDKLPRLPEHNDPQYIEKFSVIFNFLNSNLALYTIALKVIPTIHEIDFIDWASNGFWNSKLLLELIKSVDIESIYYLSVRSAPESFYTRIISIISPILTLYSLPLMILSKLGNHWFDQIKTYDVFPSKNVEGLINYGNSLISLVSGIEEKLQELYKKKVIDVNMDPSKNDALNNIIFLIKHNLKDHLDTVTVLNNYFKDNRTSEEKIEELEKRIQETNVFIQQIATLQGTSTENNVRSVAGQLLIEKLELLTLLNSVLSIERKNSKYLFDFIGHYQPILSQIPPKTAPALHMYVLLSKLYVQTKTQEEIEYYQLLREINENIKEFSIYPRDYVALLILKAILTFLDKEEYTPEIEKILLEGEQVFINSGNDHLKDIYSQYVDALKKAFNNEQTFYEFDLANIELNPVDPVSWLIPDFSKNHMTKNEKSGSILYIPFNIAKFSIIPKSFS